MSNKIDIFINELLLDGMASDGIVSVDASTLGIYNKIIDTLKNSSSVDDTDMIDAATAIAGLAVHINSTAVMMVLPTKLIPYVSTAMTAANVAFYQPKIGVTLLNGKKRELYEGMELITRTGQTENSSDISMFDMGTEDNNHLGQVSRMWPGFIAAHSGSGNALQVCLGQSLV